MRENVNITPDDLISLLENKIHYGDANEREYDLYVLYKSHGEIVFSLNDYKHIVKSLKKQLMSDWGY